MIDRLKPQMAVAGTNDRGKPVFPDGTAIQSVDGNTVVLTRPANIPGHHTLHFTDPSLVDLHSELLMMETSRVGLANDPSNSRFTLQPQQDDAANVNQITLPDTEAITLVMDWLGANMNMTFAGYDGTSPLADLPKTPNIESTASASQNPFIPNTSFQTYQLNLWRVFWKNPPNPKPEEITVPNDQYRP